MCERLGSEKELIAGSWCKQTVDFAYVVLCPVLANNSRERVPNLQGINICSYSCTYATLYVATERPAQPFQIQTPHNDYCGSTNILSQRYTNTAGR